MSGANVYTSTATLNTSHVSTVQCSDDGGLSQTLPIILKGKLVHCNFNQFIILPFVHLVEDRVIFNDDTTIGTNIVVRWSAPADAGVCCEQFRVMTSQNSFPFDTTITNTVLTNISTPERQESANVSVRCRDQIGTLGPEVVYRPNTFIQSIYLCIRLYACHKGARQRSRSQHINYIY